MSLSNDTSLDTLFVHAGQAEAWPEEYPTAPAIIPSTSFRPKSPEAMDAILGGDASGFTYSRHANPTVHAFSEAVRLLENGDTAQAFSSGMAALDAALFAIGLGPGDKLLLSRDLYGATLNLTQELWGSMGIVAETVDLTDLTALRALLDRLRPKGLVVETLSNPLLKVPNLPVVIRESHKVDCPVIVDNTFATPVLCRPLNLGADLVVHSATKYLGGHGDAIGGVVAGKERYASRLHQYVKLRGSVLGAFDAWLLLRGIKTLGVRIARQCSNAHEVALRLGASGQFHRVYYPALNDHPSHAVAQALFGQKGYGAVVTVDVPGGRERVFHLLSRLKMVKSATTVGDVYTLCLYPRIASHRNQTSNDLALMGISDETVRVAVGLESVDDIVHDILQALA